jgi:hypothetical protein
MAEAVAGTAPAGGIDAMVDSALEAMTADGFTDTPEGVAALKGKQGKPKPTEVEDELSLLDRELADDGIESEGDEDEEADDEPEPTKGTKADPLTVNDLPEDRFIKLKIDGKEETVSLRELADGHIREQTFHAQVKQIKDLPAKIEQLKAEFNQRLTGTKSRVNQLLSDPAMLDQFFSQDPEMEAVALDFAKRVARRAAEDKANPAAKQQRHLERERETLRREREEHERTTREQQQRHQATEAANRRAAELQPAWESALKETGFPAATQELFDLVQANVAAATKRQGKPISAEDFKAITIRAVKFLDLKPGTQKPAPAGKPAKTREERRAEPKKNPHRKGTVDHLLFGVKPRKF